MTLLTTLAIEAAIGGGSLAIVKGDDVLARWQSPSGKSRSEALLPEIARLLKDSSFQRSDIEKVAVSVGPGSYTGIRIGIATALGLAAALQIPCVGVSLMDSLIARFNPDLCDLIVIPVGRSNFCWGRGPEYAADIKRARVRTGSIVDLSMEIYEKPPGRIIAHREAIRAGGDTMASAETLGDNIAEFIGLGSETRDDGLAPIYPDEQDKGS